MIFSTKQAGTLTGLTMASALMGFGGNLLINKSGDDNSNDAIGPLSFFKSKSDHTTPLYLAIGSLIGYGAGYYLITKDKATATSTTHHSLFNSFCTTLGSIQCAPAPVMMTRTPFNEEKMMPGMNLSLQF